MGQKKKGKKYSEVIMSFFWNIKRQAFKLQNIILSQNLSL